MIEIILDASQIEMFETCPKKWYYSYVQNLTTKTPNSALSTGSYFHEVLKYYYTLIWHGAAPSKSIRPALEYGVDLIKNPTESRKWPEVTKEPQFYIDRLRAYFYANLSDDENMEVISVEKGFSWLLYESKHCRYILEGLIDLVTRKVKTGITVTDHKTQSRAYDKYFYNHQAANYMIATGAKYFEYNYIGLQDKINENTFNKPIWTPPPGYLEQWKIDVKLVFEQMHSMLSVRPAIEYFPRRRTSCQTKFGICEFHSICQIPDSSPWQPIVINSKYKEKDEKWKAWS